MPVPRMLLALPVLLVSTRPVSLSDVLLASVLGVIPLAVGADGVAVYLVVGVRGGFLFLHSVLDWMATLFLRGQWGLLALLSPSCVVLFLVLPHVLRSR